MFLTKLIQDFNFPLSIQIDNIEYNLNYYEPTIPIQLGYKDEKISIDSNNISYTIYLNPLELIIENNMFDIVFQEDFELNNFEKIFASNSFIELIYKLNRFYSNLIFL